MKKPEYKEEQFNKITDHSQFRHAQIAISKLRLNYLLVEYSPSVNDRYIMFPHPGHFLIYDTDSMRCIFDATYEIIVHSDPNTPEDEIAAVVSSMIIYEDETSMKDGDDMFSLLVKLIETDL